MKFGTSILTNAFQSLRISPARPVLGAALKAPATPSMAVRAISTTAPRMGSWLEPNIDRTKKMMKGRPRVATGGSTKGTTVIWGDYGLRMVDKHRRISAKQLKNAEDTIKNRLRGTKYRLYKRVACNVGVYVSGNEIRMGKGKGGFDHWACRMAVNQIVFEIRGLLHEKVIRDAFRLAGSKLPGQWEFVTKDAAPVVGMTKLENGLTLEDLKRPWKKTGADEATSAPATPSDSPATPPPAT
ncbi:hypothetical protein TD95_001992, partial [Thielaviopsis punctulata]